MTLVHSWCPSNLVRFVHEVRHTASGGGGVRKPTRRCGRVGLVARASVWGYRTDMVGIRRLHSAKDAASIASDLLSAGRPLRTVWRHSVIQLFDNYESVRRHEGVELAAAMWRSRPKSAGDPRVDAAIAGLGEWLATRDGWVVPTWIHEVRAGPDWYVVDLPSVREWAKKESPAPFRSRNVWITRAALERA